MRSRFLAELTTPEVESYLARGGRTALLPVGSVEMHGPHQPIGTDTLIAKAFALRLAEEADGLVLPEIHYTWAGSTDGFAGTVSIEPELVQKTVEAIALKVFRMGLRRLLVLSVHRGRCGDNAAALGPGSPGRSIQVRVQLDEKTVKFAQAQCHVTAKGLSDELAHRGAFYHLPRRRHVLGTPLYRSHSRRGPVGPVAPVALPGL